MSWQWVVLILGLALNITIIIVAANLYESGENGQQGSSNSRRELTEDQDRSGSFR